MSVDFIEVMMPKASHVYRFYRSYDAEGITCLWIFYSSHSNKYSFLNSMSNSLSNSKYSSLNFFFK